MAMDVALAMREESPHHNSRDAIPTEKVSTEATQALTLVQREEKLISRKERLAREERKKEISYWLMKSEPNVDGIKQFLNHFRT